jgi:5-methylcytosine-specific restriction protein B
MTSLSDRRVRALSVDDLGLTLPPSASSSAAGSVTPSARSARFATTVKDASPFPPDHELLVRVRELLEHYGGVILVGPPGTSKTWSAERLALALAGNVTRTRTVQFHPSYQYEDFVEGIVFTPDGKFQYQPKHLMALAEEAEQEPEFTFVLVIEELSRGDAARIFGEGLTGIEASKRGRTFTLASGSDLTIPPNLVVVATMNALDRGVDEVDAAFERRFAKITMDPDVRLLEQLLEAVELPAPLRSRVIDFFLWVNERAAEEPQAALGHTYFDGMADERALRRLWDHQLRFFFEKAYRFDPDRRAEVEQRWARLFDEDGSSTAAE